MHFAVRRKGLLGVAFAAALAVAPARAEREGASYLSYVGSEVTLVSRASDDTSSRVGTPLLAGDRLQTGGSSRAEAILADGNVLRVDARSAVRFDRLAATWESDDDRDLIVLEKGSVSLETRASTSRDLSPRIDTDDATVTVPDRAVVRVDAGRRGTEIHVLSGRADVAGRAGRAVVRAGESAYVSGEEPIEVDASSSPRDRFARFVDERRERSAPAGTVRHVADEYAYDYDQGDLEEYGSWNYLSTVDDFCWRPNVAAGWLPYSNGYWRWTPGGQAWVSYESWGWLPFHYGSWLLDPALGWCWSPGRRYAPAWVYWNYSNGWVGWCPIGYYGHYGQYGPWGRDRSGRGGGYPHLAGRIDLASIDRRGWSFVSVDRFGARFDPKDVLRGDRIPFRPGQGGLVSTAPLRVERGGHPTMALAVQESARRLSLQPSGDARGRTHGAEQAPALAEILRREPNLSAAGRDELRRAWVRTGDASFRPATVEAIAQGKPFLGARDAARRTAPDGASARDLPPPSASWREPAPGAIREVRVEGGRSGDGGRGTLPRSDDGWRSSAVSRSGSGREPVTSRRLDDSSRPTLRRADQPPLGVQTPREGPRGHVSAPHPAPGPAPHSPAPSHPASGSAAHKGR